jgi:hypothetical protein
MTGISRSFLLLMLAGAISGCSTLYKRVDPDMDIRDVSFKPGETHYHEVLDRIGPPGRLTATGEGVAFLYESMLIRELQAGIGGQSDWLKLIKISVGDSRLYRDVLVLRFDQEGILISEATSDTSEGLGKSGGVQLFLTVKQLVDTDQYEDDAVEVSGWGMALLKPLPRGLNQHQSLTSGSAGFEQSGTTSKTGQHTLEMR